MHESLNIINKCHEVGCPDLCCKRMWIETGRGEQRRVFPNAVHVPWYTEVREMHGQTSIPDYVSGKPQNLVYTGDRCPHLNVRGCDGERTEACKRFEFGGDACNRLRTSNGLAPIDRNGNVLQVPKKRRKILGFI